MPTSYPSLMDLSMPEFKDVMVTRSWLKSPFSKILLHDLKYFKAFFVLVQHLGEKVAGLCNQIALPVVVLAIWKYICSHVLQINSKLACMILA